MNRRYVDRIETPLGRLTLVVDDEDRLCVASFATETSAHWIPAKNPGGICARLEAYFSGTIGALDAISTNPDGTPFQRAVWDALRQIPAGETWSYGRLAAHIGRPKAVRAVGRANGANPIGVVVPCHRVIGADGSLTGYAGGLHRKRWLLAHEGTQLSLL